MLGIEGSIAAGTAILFSLTLAYVLVKIFTIDFEDEITTAEVEPLDSKDAVTNIP
ncbi:hypothetical protein [Kaarinaea lacus]